MRFSYLKTVWAATGLIMITACSGVDQNSSDSNKSHNDSELVQNASQLVFPMSDVKILYAQKFEVEVPFIHYFQSEKPRLTSGTLVVFEADREYIQDRNNLEPILYAGNQTVQRLNRPHLSGRVMGIIPGTPDLADTPIWYGRPGLPEQLTSDVIEKEYQSASRSGLVTLPLAQVNDVLADPVRSKNLSEYLRDHASDVVLQFLPQEESLAKSWRLPVVGSDLQ